jgi:hypothetical protein
MSGIRWLVLLAVVAVAGLAPGVASAQDSVRRGDVLFVFDTTGSMGGAISGAKAEIRDVMGRVSQTIPDVQFGVADLRDYPQTPYGQSDDYPWRLRQGITPDPGAVQSAVDSLTTGGGGDGPESYETALQSAMGSSVGWRPGAEHMVVLIGDNVPHDDALNDDPVPSDEWTQPSPFRTWDATAGSLGPDWQGVLRQMRDNRYPLLFVYYYGNSAYIPYWRWWAGATNGSYTEPGSAPISDAIVEIIHRQATAPCPAGESRDSNGVCAPGGGGGETPTGGGDVLPYNCVAIAGGVRCGPPSCTVAAPSKAKPKPRRRSRRRSSRRRRARSSEVTARAAQRPIPKVGEQRFPHLHTDPKQDPAPYKGLTDDLKKQLGTGCAVIGGVGDSFTAWHHLRQDGELDCKDPDGYFRSVWAGARGFKYWTEAPGVNAAYSGFTTTDVMKGGTDYCGNPSAPKAPVQVMQELIGASKQANGTKTGQGDLVFVSLPINNEDWFIPMAKRLIPKRLIPRVEWNGGDPRVSFDRPDPATCEELFTKSWSLTKEKVVPGMKDVFETLIRADVPGEKNAKEAIKKSKVKIYVVRYPNPAGTGYLDFGKRKGFITGKEYDLRYGPLMPESCRESVQKRLDEMASWSQEAAEEVDGKDTPHVDFVKNEDVKGNGNFQQVINDDALQKRMKEAVDKIGEKWDKGLAKMLETLSAAIGTAEQALERARKRLEERNSRRRRAAVRAAEAVLEKAKQALDDFLQKRGLSSNVDIEDWKKPRVGWPHQSAEGNKKISANVLSRVKAGAGL